MVRASESMDFGCFKKYYVSESKSPRSRLQLSQNASQMLLKKKNLMRMSILLPFLAKVLADIAVHDWLKSFFIRIEARITAEYLGTATVPRVLTFKM